MSESETPFQSLKNQLLIAMPALKDSWFGHTVTYICDHNEEGAMGLVLNRTADLPLEDVLEQLDITPEKNAQQQVYSGGPVSQEHGFVLHDGSQQWDSTLTITDNIHITTSKDILLAIASGTGPEKNKIALGYAGWDAGQLEQEMLNNAWLTIEASPDILFCPDPEKIYSNALAVLGIDETFLSSDAGHA